MCVTLACHPLPWERSTDPAPGVLEMDWATSSGMSQLHVEACRRSQRLRTARGVAIRGVAPTRAQRGRGLGERRGVSNRGVITRGVATAGAVR